MTARSKQDKLFKPTWPHFTNFTRNIQ